MTTTCDVTESMNTVRENDMRSHLDFSYLGVDLHCFFFSSKGNEAIPAMDDKGEYSPLNAAQC